MKIFYSGNLNCGVLAFSPSLMFVSLSGELDKEETV